MGIQINGQNDTVSASDGSINISGEITANVINQTVTGVTTFTDAEFSTGFNVAGVVTTTTLDATTVKVGTAVTISAGVVTATSFSGDGSGLSGIDASSLKSGGVVKVQANSSGSVTTGVATVTSKISVGDSFIQNGAVGLGTTTQSDVLSGVGTAVGQIVYVPALGLQVYSGALAGWKTIAGTSGLGGVTGGDINAAPSGGKLYHVFQSSGTLEVVGPRPQVSILVVAGGGGGASYGGNGGAGGGAGGVAVYPNFNLEPGTYTVAVGGGGAGAASAPNPGTAGADSTFGTAPQPAYIFADGGGSGSAQPNPQSDGGSGGGGDGNTWPTGTGTQPTQNSGNPNILNYGNPGGTGSAGPGGLGGGGGAGGAGPSGPPFPAAGRPGGVGQPLPAFNSAIGAFSPMPSDWISAVGPTGLYGGGGGAGATSGSGGTAGPGGGGTGGGGNGVAGQTPGVQYTGGGGGGTGYGAPNPAGNGADGVVIIFYPE